MGGDTFDLPLRALIPDGIEGLVMGTGRSISASNPGLLRVMVHAMAVDGVAGHMAAQRFLADGLGMLSDRMVTKQDGGTHALQIHPY